MGSDGPFERPDGPRPSIPSWTTGGERPGSTERGKSNLLTTYEFYYFIIILEIQLRAITGDGRPPRRPSGVARHYHRIGRDWGRPGAVVSLPGG